MSEEKLQPKNDKETWCEHVLETRWGILYKEGDADEKDEVKWLWQ